MAAIGLPLHNPQKLDGGAVSVGGFWYVIIISIGGGLTPVSAGGPDPLSPIKWDQHRRHWGHCFVEFPGASIPLSTPKLHPQDVKACVLRGKSCSRERDALLFIWQPQELECNWHCEQHWE